MEMIFWCVDVGILIG